MPRLIYLLISFSLVFHCLVCAKEEDPVKPKSLKLVIKNISIDPTNTTLSDRPLQCVTRNYKCRTSEFLCSDLHNGGSCNCALNKKYNIVFKDPTPKTDPTQLCESSWHYAPTWILFLAIVGSVVLSVALVFVARFSWPLLQQWAQLANNSSRQFMARQRRAEESDLIIQQNVDSMFNLEDEDEDEDEHLPISSYRRIV